MDRLWRLLILIFTIVFFDQFTKALVQENFALGETISIIEGYFNFTYVRNPGAAFGMGVNAPHWLRLIAFFIIPTIACFCFLWILVKNRDMKSLTAYAYSLILAGAIGNLWDRFQLNYVVDFLDFHYKGSHFPAFNIADSSITIAAFLLIIDLIITAKEERKLKS